MRRDFDENALKALAASIRTAGLLQPVTVRPREGGQFELIAGERRLRACKMLGMREIDALILHVSAGESAILALVENLQREDLHYLDEAEGYANTLRACSLTQEALAQKIGKSQSALANKLRLLQLTPEVRESLKSQGLSERHARALLRMNDPHAQLEAIRQAKESNLTVRQMETLIALMCASRPQQSARRRILPLVRDGRVYVNAFERLVSQMEEAGVEAELSVGEEEGGIRIGVWIPRNQSLSQTKDCPRKENICSKRKNMV